MKKIILITSVSVLMLNMSCKKSTDGNKGIIKTKTEGSANAQAEVKKEETLRYVAEDGSSALVTFIDSEIEHSISVKSNNKIINAPRKEVLANGSVYGDHDFEITAKNDSVTITQGNNVILLKKARGQ